MIDERKFAKRIKHKFEKCTYIGDISINDEEYDLLMEFFRNCYPFFKRFNSENGVLQKEKKDYCTRMALM